MNEPVLVTGGAGFIGSHLVEELLRRGARIRVIDDLSSGSLENLAPFQGSERLEITVGSVRDPHLFRQVLTGCGEVYHLAASVGVGRITADPGDCLRNNLEGVQNLLAAALEEPRFPRIVLFSSSEVYGKSERIPLREDEDLVLGPSSVPRWSYASGKIVGEFLALSEHRRRRLPVIVVRCFNTCGPRQRPNDGMVVPRFLDQALAEEPISVYGDGGQTRCFSFVQDVVGGVLRLAQTPEAIGEIVNIGTDQETSILALAEAVRGITRSGSPIRLVPHREVYGDSFEDVRRRVPDLSKIRRLIGYQPKTDLFALLRLTLEARRNGTQLGASGATAALGGDRPVP